MFAYGRHPTKAGRFGFKAVADGRGDQIGLLAVFKRDGCTA